MAVAQVLGTDEIAAHVREITDDEVQFYFQHGWVKLDGLVSRELAAELLRVGEEWHEREQKNPTEWHALARDPRAEPWGSLVFSDIMGRNAQRLINRRRLGGDDIPVRYRTDHFICKPPGAGGTPYHQDSTEHGSDRVGEMQWWLALVEVTPEMGAMRFVTGSHKEGPLGTGLTDAGDLLTQYPAIIDVLELSPPFHYKPGDATVHHGYTIHGSPPNHTDRPRMSSIMSYMPADVRFWNGKVGNWGSERVPLGDDECPIVYPKEKGS